MLVNGLKIEEHQLGELVARMKREPFTAAAITLLAESLGIPNDANSGCAAMRVADRLIQREKKAVNIKLDGRIWSWVAK